MRKGQSRALRSEARIGALRNVLERVYAEYGAKWMDPDPVQFVWRYSSAEDREVAGLIASSLAYGNVKQIKRSIEIVLASLGPNPASRIDSLDGPAALSALRGFKHRFNDARDAACLLVFIREMRRQAGSIESFFAEGAAASDLGSMLTSFVRRSLSLPRDGLYGRGKLPKGAGVRFFFPSPESGSACKRLCLYLRWMVRKDSVDPGVWTSIPRSVLLIPLDAHILNIGRSAKLTRRRSPGWKMAVDITQTLRACDADDPVKYDFALHRMGLFKRTSDLLAVREA